MKSTIFLPSTFLFFQILAILTFYYLTVKIVFFWKKNFKVLTWIQECYSPLLKLCFISLWQSLFQWTTLLENTVKVEHSKSALTSERSKIAVKSSASLTKFFILGSNLVFVLFVYHHLLCFKTLYCMDCRLWNTSGQQNFLLFFSFSWAALAEINKK